MQTAHQMLEEEIKNLREADQLLPVHIERRHFDSTELDHLTLVAAVDVVTNAAEFGGFRRAGVHGVGAEQASC